MPPLSSANTGFQQTSVLTFYKRWSGPAWFEDNGQAIAELARILRRGVLDGFTQGPELAADVERAAKAAQAGGEVDRTAAERLFSAAWVSYAEAIRQPVRNMIYGYSTLKPSPDSAEKILSAAASAPSLAEHLAAVAQINPTYAQLRDNAWRQMQESSASPIDPRVQLNLMRLRSLPQTDRFALVNVATQELVMYEDGRPVDSMKVIVGMKDLPTPMISSVIYYVTYNPYWNVPDHLVRKTVAPNVLRQGQGYLSSRGYQVLSDWSEDPQIIPSDQVDWKAVASGATKIRVRQLPGPGNSMGKLKFSFANGEDIFLHDTPSKDLFDKPVRSLSNGCVRLEDARRFGRWLLGTEPVAPSSAPEQFQKLPGGVPVYITYLTAELSDGKIVYANDIYGWDSQHLAVAANTTASRAAADNF